MKGSKNISSQRVKEGHSEERFQTKRAPSSAI